jgi:hypothetical protein
MSSEQCVEGAGVSVYLHLYYTQAERQNGVGVVFPLLSPCPMYLEMEPIILD